MQVSRVVAGSATLSQSDEAAEGRGGASLPRLTQAVGAALAAVPVAALAQVELPPATVSEERHGGFRAASTGSPKDPEALRDTARSVSVIPQEVIRTTAATSLTEVLRTVPGITFGAGEGGNPIGDRPFIRGYDAQASTFLDGFRDIGAQSREMFNVESVQVNKGRPAPMTGGAAPAARSISRARRPGWSTSPKAPLAWAMPSTCARRWTATGAWASTPPCGSTRCPTAATSPGATPRA
nr:TonB-dependent receptor plug domain-containing protein [Cupriavidus campinensis]